MLSTATIVASEAAAKLLQRVFAPDSKDVAEAFVLAYLVESNKADGSAVPGFQPGYIPTVWPATQFSKNWVVARLANGADCYFLPRDQWGKGGEFKIDVIDPAVPTFSIFRK